MIILDTNVLSELMRPTPHPRVVAWIAKQSATELFTTSITEAEIFYGPELLAKGKRREGLLAAAEAMFAEDLADRVLGFDSPAARAFPGLPLTAAPSQTYQSCGCARSQPLPECEQPSSRLATLRTSRTRTAAIDFITGIRPSCWLPRVRPSNAILPARPLKVWRNVE
jgi:toxin FitB